jgi:hypothetical protein
LTIAAPIVKAPKLMAIMMDNLRDRFICRFHSNVVGKTAKMRSVNAAQAFKRYALVFVFDTTAGGPTHNHRNTSHLFQHELASSLLD